MPPLLQPPRQPPYLRTWKPNPRKTAVGMSREDIMGAENAAGPYVQLRAPCFFQEPRRSKEIFQTVVEREPPLTNPGSYFPHQSSRFPNQSSAPCIPRRKKSLKLPSSQVETNKRSTRMKRINVFQTYTCLILAKNPSRENKTAPIL